MEPIRQEAGHATWDESLDTHLERRAQMYEEHLHMRNFLRMQEILDEESFERWNRLRFSKRATSNTSPEAPNRVAIHERSDSGENSCKKFVFPVLVDPRKPKGRRG